MCSSQSSETNSKGIELEQLGKNLCMHIAASKPIAIDIDIWIKNLLKKKKKFKKKHIKSYGKPEQY